VSEQSGLIDKFPYQMTPVIFTAARDARICDSGDERMKKTLIALLLLAVGRMKKTDSGTRTAALTVTNNSVDSVGSTISLGTSFAYFTQVQETDPNTGIPWTNSGFNTAQVGVKTVS
jgi:hypothetical protein